MQSIKSIGKQGNIYKNKTVGKLTFLSVHDIFNWQKMK